MYHNDAKDVSKSPCTCKLGPCSLPIPRAEFVAILLARLRCVVGVLGLRKSFSDGRIASDFLHHVLVAAQVTFHFGIKMGQRAALE